MLFRVICIYFIITLMLMPICQVLTRFALFTLLVQYIIESFA